MFWLWFILYLFSILHVGHVAHAGHVACMLTLLNLIVIFARYICQRPHWAPYFFFVHDLLPCLLCCQIFELMSLLVPFRHKITKISYFVFKYINWHYSRFRTMCFLGIFDKKKIEYYIYLEIEYYCICIYQEHKKYAVVWSQLENFLAEIQ